MHEDHILSNYHFDLPQELIADRPAKRRDQSRLLVYNEAEDRVEHRYFYELPHLIPSLIPRSTQFVFNQTKVFPCRLIGKKNTGGKVEVFILSLKIKDGCYPAMIKTTSKKKVGDHYFFEDELVAKLEYIDEKIFWIRFNQQNFSQVLLKQGMVPIPPYIRGGVSDEQDKADYQTVYASLMGSVAAPTAGLHFTQTLMDEIKSRGAEISMLTLHVGMGTFAPVKSEFLQDHKMHSEEYSIGNLEWENIIKSPFRLAVGTTSLRALESAFTYAQSHNGEPFSPAEIQATDIFLYPGRPVYSIHGLLTNFHLPESSLLMLVSALVGRDKSLKLYKEAISCGYRFFSYGDAMLIIRDPKKIPTLTHEPGQINYGS